MTLKKFYKTPKSCCVESLIVTFLTAISNSWQETNEERKALFQLTAYEGTRHHSKEGMASGLGQLYLVLLPKLWLLEYLPLHMNLIFINICTHNLKISICIITKIFLVHITDIYIHTHAHTHYKEYQDFQGFCHHGQARKPQ